eukprot:TRINITY_DN1397_c0_g1_i2.p1 TRINITY_DN1397_c0_g1~~TRINITY_DN1397_c0_g1_i2.p1  ORF type:complete len:785 (-),score=122.53 TRINITY_DN1397_c0_g1_i2:42-2330(-)
MDAAEQKIAALMARVVALEKGSGEKPANTADKSCAKKIVVKQDSSFMMKYPKEKAPVLVLAMHAILKATCKGKFNCRAQARPEASQPDVTLECFPSKDLIIGASPVSLFLAKRFSDTLAPSDPKGAALTLTFLALAQHIQAGDITHLDFVNKHLTLRTYVIGYSLTIGDIALFLALHQSKAYNQIATDKKRRNAVFHIRRWFSFIESIKEIEAFLAVMYPATASDAGNSSDKVHSKATYKNLPGAVHGKVVTRFPPEPSGYLHLGHCKAAMLNDKYRQVYDGKLVLRFDDTNPSKENVDFVNAIREDLKTLGIKESFPISYTSDWFKEIAGFAEQMIKDGFAYVDKSPAAQISDERMKMIESQYRNTSVEENLKLWEEMKQGTDEGQKCVLRAKIDMTSKNGTMRDPAIYRVVTHPPHHRTGTQFKVYPIYDFACPIVDSLEGVTHALRSNEYRLRDEQYRWMLKALRVRPVAIKDFSRLNFKYTVMSKRKLQKFVDSGLVDGWDSPAFPTVRGVFRRGLTLEALQTFIYSQGSSHRETLQDMNKLWALNKQLIDRQIKRFSAVPADAKVKLVLSNGPDKVEHSTALWCKQNPDLGKKTKIHTKSIWIAQDDAKLLKNGEEFTLMDWGNCVVEKIVKEGDTITQLEGKLNVGGDYTKTKWKLTWVPIVDDLVPVDLVEYGNLVTVERLEKGQNFEDFINPNLKTTRKFLGDPALRLLPKGERIQIERIGYYICDSAFRGFQDKPLVLINIPDGKKKKAKKTK